MPTIKTIPRKNGPPVYRFVVDVGVQPDTGKRMQKTYTFEDYDEAEVKLAEITIEKHRGTFVVPSNVTVREWIEHWLAVAKGNVKKTTYEYYKDRLVHVVDKFGDKPIQKLEKGHLEDLKQQMHDGTLRRSGGRPGVPLAAKTVNGTIVTMRSCLTDALIEKVVYVNAAVGIKPVKDRGKKRKSVRERRASWQPQHSVEFLEYVKGHRLEGAWWLSMLGQRRGEVCGHYWDETLDLDEGELWVEVNRVVAGGEIYEDSTKSEASDRWLPIPAPALEALKRTRAIQAAEQLAAGPAYHAPPGGPKTREEWYLAAVHEDVDNKARWISQQLRAQGDLISEAGVHSWIGRLRRSDGLPKAPYVGSGLMVVDELGRPLRPQYYSDLFEQLTKEAGLPPITVHGARHFAASLFGHLGVDIVVAAAWLGQSQTSITEQYQHAFHDALRSAGAQLGQALQSGL